jgi:serine/threonine protein kinase
MYRRPQKHRFYLPPWVDLRWCLLFFDMELCSGTLQDHIKGRFVQWMDYKDPNIPIKEKLSEMWSIMSQLASGVDFLHSHGVVHRDLKPTNSILTLYRALANPSSLPKSR